MQTTTKIDKAQACALEECEAVYWSKYYGGSTSLPSYATTIGGAFAGAMPENDILAMNRVIGLGIHKTVQPQHLDALVDFYSRAGSKRFFVQISPTVQQDDLQELLRSKGFRHHNNWVKLWRQSHQPISEADTTLEIVEVGSDEAQAYGQILYESFDWEDARLAEWLATPVGKAGYRHYLALQNGVSVAAAALHIYGSWASLAFAGTLGGHRGLGAQSVLIHRRLMDAAQADCRYVVAETAEPTPNHPVASYQNLRRFGFQEAYRRANWIWEF